jgi:hypothetical protein
MKILHVIHPVVEGGGEHLLDILLQESLSDETSAHSILSLSSNDYLRKSCESKGLEYLSNDMFSSKYQYSKLDLFIRTPLILAASLLRVWQGKYEVVHCHSFPNQWFVLFMKVVSSKSVFGFTKHIQGNQSAFSAFIWRLIIKKHDFFTFVSSSCAKPIFRDRVVFDNVKIIHNPVPRYFFSQEKSSTECSLNRPIAACVVARVTHGKGHLELLDYLEASKDIWCGRLKIHIAGDGELLEPLVRAVSQKNLKNDVIIYGKITQNEVFSLMRSSDFAIHNSSNDGFSLACAQYIVTSTPVLFRAYGPTHEVVLECGEPFNCLTSFQNGLKGMLEHSSEYLDDCVRQSDRFKPNFIYQEYLLLYRDSLKHKGQLL